MVLKKGSFLGDGRYLLENESYFEEGDVRLIAEEGVRAPNRLSSSRAVSCSPFAAVALFPLSLTFLLPLAFFSDPIALPLQFLGAPFYGQ